MKITDEELKAYGLWIPRKARQRILVLGATIRSRLGVGDDSRDAKQSKRRPNGNDRRVFYTRAHLKDQLSGRGDQMEDLSTASLPLAPKKKVLDNRTCLLIEKVIRYLRNDFFVLL